MGTLLLGLPWLVLSAGVVVFTVVAVASVVATFRGETFGDESIETTVWATVCVFVASGLLTVWAPTETVLVRVFHRRVRRPTADEQRQLDAVWGAVTAAAGVDGSRYRLWVHDIDAVNAFAAFGHTVAVTSVALHGVPPRHLEALLAHELGHHLGGHSWGRLLMYWYSLPGRFLVRVCWLSAVVAAMFAGVLMLAFGRARYVRAPGMLQLLIAAAGFGYALYRVDPRLLVAFVALCLLPVVVAWVYRRDERYADRVATDLGYGPLLADVLAAWMEHGAGMPGTLRGIVLASHPSHASRIKAVQKRIDRNERRTARRGLDPAR